MVSGNGYDSVLKKKEEALPAARDGEVKEGVCVCVCASGRTRVSGHECVPPFLGTSPSFASTCWKGVQFGSDTNSTVTELPSSFS